MNHKPAAHAATESTRAIVYQLCVAVEKCYEMKVGEKVYVEKLGDVTIKDRDQTEVKVYKEPLTDGHENFWKTLKNWVHDDFSSSPYNSLILYTTQAFGEKATLSSFNNSDLKTRLSLIHNIYKSGEDRMADNLVKNKKASIPAVLNCQRYVFNESRKHKLEDVIGKMVIEAMAPELPQLYADIQQVWIKGVLKGKKTDFLNALIGFITKPDALDGEDWEITYEEFCGKIAELHRIYGSETRTFPRACFDDCIPLDNDQLAHYHGFNFIKKIKDIDYHEVISDAIQDYLQTMNTLHEEFKTYAVSSQRTKNYTDEVVRRFETEHRKASRNCTDIIRDSQTFYDNRTGEESLQFEGFDNRPIVGFRNGVLHIEMNEDDDRLKWRLDHNE